MRYIADAETGQALEILSDKTSKGKERPWREHKIANQSVEQYYRRLAGTSSEQGYWLKRADRLRDCGAKLWFNVYADGDYGEMKKIKNASSCRVRLCPLCTWRRSIKIQVHTRKILERMQATERYEYLLLTLTVPNVTGAELSDKITAMMEAWHKFAGYKRFQESVQGWYRGLEVTHNVNRLSRSYDTYHPHFHCIVAVKMSYFQDKSYIKQEEWLKMWQKSMRNDRITQVDVRKVRAKEKDGDAVISAVCEVAKYTVKSGDYILPWDWELSCQSVEVLDQALANRRLVAYGGVMKEWHKKLNLDDEIDGNLIEDGETPNGELIGEVCAVWNVGYRQYLIAG